MPPRPGSRFSGSEVASGIISGVDEFAIVFDVEALRWVNEHPSRDALVIAYSDTRC